DRSGRPVANPAYRFRSSVGPRNRQATTIRVIETPRPASIASGSRVRPADRRVSITRRVVKTAREARITTIWTIRTARAASITAGVVADDTAVSSIPSGGMDLHRRRLAAAV